MLTCQTSNITSQINNHYTWRAWWYDRYLTVSVHHVALVFTALTRGALGGELVNSIELSGRKLKLPSFLQTKLKAANRWETMHICTSVCTTTFGPNSHGPRVGKKTAASTNIQAHNHWYMICSSIETGPSKQNKTTKPSNQPSKRIPAGIPQALASPSPNTSRVAQGLRFLLKALIAAAHPGCHHQCLAWGDGALGVWEFVTCNGQQQRWMVVGNNA